MAFVEYAIRAVGLFYALGAIFLIRQMAMSEVLDRSLRAMEGRPELAKDIVRRWLLGAGAALTGASGVAALLASSWAMPLFAANLVVQVGWLIWSSTAFPPQDEEDRLGRRRTFNAAFFYATVTATVFALGLEGLLRPWGEWQSAVPVAAGTLAYCVYLARTLGSLLLPMRDERSSDPDYRQPTRVRFEVHPWQYPMVDADDGRRLPHYTYLDITSANRVERWHGRFAGLAGGADADASTIFASEEEEGQHRAEAESLVEMLRGIYGAENVEGPVYLPRESWGPPGDGDGSDAVVQTPMA
jgi:hypothetical protein